MVTATFELSLNVLLYLPFLIIGDVYITYFTNSEKDYLKTPTVQIIQRRLALLLHCSVEQNGKRCSFLQNASLTIYLLLKR